MAKSNKSQVPKINPPNSGLRSWLNQGNPEATESASGGLDPKVTATQTEGEITKPEVFANTQEVTPPQPVTNVSTGGDGETADKEGIIKGNEGEVSVVEGTANEIVTAPRKPKSKGGEGSKSSYLETFFKKPVKANGASLASEGKPIRVTEESHLLLSVLVSEARRLGYKLNVGDFVDNLLANHRSEHKREVDELIATWKTRKSFD